MVHPLTVLHQFYNSNTLAAPFGCRGKVIRAGLCGKTYGFFANAH
jgi:hypothetical protein